MRAKYIHWISYLGSRRQDKGYGNHQTTWICLALGFVTFALYWSITGHEFINFDDPEYLSENPHVRTGLTWENVGWAFRTGYFCSWHPLTWISHMADCQLYGLNPGGHHFTNLLFHIANTLLVFLVLRQMTGALWRSAFVAALFAWHPLHVESVAWASERKDVLSTFFFLLSLSAYTRYVKSRASNLQSPASSLGRRPWLFYVLSLVLFAFGLMSKPMVVTLPCVLLLLDYWPFQRFQLSASKSSVFCLSRLTLEKMPFFALAMAGSIITFLVQKTGGAVASLDAVPFHLRMVNALVAYLRYIAKTVWPASLAPFYPYQTHWSVPLVVLCAVLLGGWSFLVFAKARRYPYLVVGWCWFLGTLVPTIGLVQVGSQSMADRYMYIPSIGLFIVAVWGTYELRRFCAKAPALLSEKGLVAVGSAALAVYALCTWTQLQYWQNGVKLFQHAIDVTKANHAAYVYLGKAYEDAGQDQKALAYYSEAVRLAPHYVEGHYNLGTLLMQLGQTDDAIKCLEQAVSDDPGFARAYSNLGRALLTKGRPDLALVRLRQAVKLNPEWPQGHFNLGTALLGNSEFAEAVAQLSESLKLDPSNATAHMNLGVALVRQDKPADALAQFTEAARLAPRDSGTRFNLGLALLEQGRPAEASVQFAEVLKSRPEDAWAHYRLAEALARADNPAEAVVHCREALRLVPNFPEARNELALLSGEQNKGSAPNP